MDRMEMETKRRVIWAHARDYQRAMKAGKREILDFLVESTGYNRVYAARLLRLQGKRVWIKPGVAVVGDLRARPGRCRQRQYGPEVLEPLKQIWELMDFVCGKRLAPGMTAMVEALELHGELRLRARVRKKLLKISASSIDRLLAPEKRKRAARLRSRTKPGSLLKSQIPIRTFAQWDEKCPGFVEIDLVAHDGGCAQGEFAQTLDVTDVCTGWTEQRAVLNKAQRWVFEALKDIAKELPFALKGIDSDNGSEFINQHLRTYCQEQHLTFTRSRPYRKNDTCFVEQKNYSVVRRAVGYQRFVGSEAVSRLNQLYHWIALRQNFFLPSIQLQDKERQGSKVFKIYDQPQTPYERVLKSPQVDSAIKRRLSAVFKTLNPAALHRHIRANQKALGALARRIKVSEEPVTRVPTRIPQDNSKNKSRSRKTTSGSDTFLMRQ